MSTEPNAAALYPSAAPSPQRTAPDPAVSQSAAQPIESPGSEPHGGPTDASVPLSGTELTQSAPLYADLPDTRGYVRWGEPPAGAKDITFDLPPIGDHIDRTAAGDAERMQLAEALAHAGSGQTLAKEIYRDAAAAAKPDYKPVSQDACATQLQASWGRSFEANLAIARGLVAKAAEKQPEIVRFLEASGLGNDPNFIRKLVASRRKR